MPGALELLSEPKPEKGTLEALRGYPVAKMH